MFSPLQAAFLGLLILSATGAGICLMTALVLFNNPETEEPAPSLEDKWWLPAAPFFEVLYLLPIILNWKKSPIARRLLCSSAILLVIALILFYQL